jgi:hypothetical protein
VVIVTSFPTDHSFGISVTCFRAPGKSRTAAGHTLDSVAAWLDYLAVP